MTVQELTTGIPGASAHEIAVGWPMFFDVERREQDRDRKAQEKKRGTFG